MSEELMVEVKKHYLAKSSKGTPSIKFQVVSTIDERDVLWYDCWLTPDCYKQTIKTLRESLDWQGNNLADLNGTGLLAGKKCSAVVDEEEYNGVTRRKVKFLNSLGGGKVDLSEQDVFEMQSGFEKALANYGNSEKAPV